MTIIRSEAGRGRGGSETFTSPSDTTRGSGDGSTFSSTIVGAAAAAAAANRAAPVPTEDRGNPSSAEGTGKAETLNDDGGGGGTAQGAVKNNKEAPESEERQEKGDPPSADGDEDGEEEGGCGNSQGGTEGTEPNSVPLLDDVGGKKGPEAAAAESSAANAATASTAAGAADAGAVSAPTSAALAGSPSPAGAAAPSPSSASSPSQSSQLTTSSERRTNILTTIHAELDQMGRALRCPLCLSTLKSPTMLPCLHSFCHSCITKSLATARTSTSSMRRRNRDNEDSPPSGTYGDKCPVCKVKITRRGVVPSDHLADLVSCYKGTLRAFGMAPIVYDGEVEMTQFEPSQEEGIFPDEDEEEEGGEEEGGEADGGEDDGAPSSSAAASPGRKKRARDRDNGGGTGTEACAKRKKPEKPDLSACYEHIGIARAMADALSRKKQQAAAGATGGEGGGGKADDDGGEGLKSSSSSSSSATTAAAAAAAPAVAVATGAERAGGRLTRSSTAAAVEATSDAKTAAASGATATASTRSSATAASASAPTPTSAETKTTTAARERRRMAEAARTAEARAYEAKLLDQERVVRADQRALVRVAVERQRRRKDEGKKGDSGIGGAKSTGSSSITVADASATAERTAAAAAAAPSRNGGTEDATTPTSPTVDERVSPSVWFSDRSVVVPKGSGGESGGSGRDISGITTDSAILLRSDDSAAAKKSKEKREEEAEHGSPVGEAVKATTLDQQQQQQRLEVAVAPEGNGSADHRQQREEKDAHETSMTQDAREREAADRSGEWMLEELEEEEEEEGKVEVGLQLEREQQKEENKEGYDAVDFDMLGEGGEGDDDDDEDDDVQQQRGGVEEGGGLHGPSPPTDDKDGEVDVHAPSMSEDAREKEEAKCAGEEEEEEEEESLEKRLEQERANSKNNNDNVDADAAVQNENNEETDTPKTPEKKATSSGGSAAAAATGTAKPNILSIGLIVQVQSRTWPGVNKPGGVARIVKVHHADSSSDSETTTTRYDVAYVLGGREKNVDAAFVWPHEDAQEDFVSPTKKRKGRRQDGDGDEDGDEDGGERSREQRKQQRGAGPSGGRSRCSGRASRTRRAAPTTTTPGKENKTPLKSEYMPDMSYSDALKKAMADSMQKNEDVPIEGAAAAIAIEPSADKRPCVETETSSKQKKKRKTSAEGVQQDRGTNNEGGASSDAEIASPSESCQSQGDAEDVESTGMTDSNKIRLADDRYHLILGKTVIHVITSSLSEHDKEIVKLVSAELKTSGVVLKSMNDFKPQKTNLCITPAAPSQRDKSATNNGDPNVLCQYRTLKTMRSALAGIPILTPAWMKACLEQKKLVMPKGNMCVRTLPCTKEHLLDSSDDSSRPTARLGVAKYAALLQKQQNDGSSSEMAQHLPLQDSAVFLCGSWPKGSGAPKKADVQMLLRESGATIVTSAGSTVKKLKDKVTSTVVLLCDEAKTDIACGISDSLYKQVKGAKQKRIFVVNSYWLFDCISCGTILDANEYEPNSPRAKSLWQLCPKK